MDSMWLDMTPGPEFEPLTGNMKTDVLIIGGGIAGILCAYMLQRAGVQYALVEAGKICDGITKNTTAKITVQHGLIYDKLIRAFGVERAQLYLRANQAALDEYRSICRNVDCDFCEKDSFVYSLTDPRKTEKEAEALQKLGLDPAFSDELPLPLSVAGAVGVRRQAQFHPLKFAFSIAGGLNIFENTKVRELTPGGALTNRGKIRAERIIIATHFPMLNKHGGYFLKLYQHRSYVLALKNAADVRGMYVDESGKGLSFRNYNDMLLLGGGSHRTGRKGGCWHELTRFTRRNYPDARVVSRWATQDCMSLDGVPYIGQYSRRTPDVYVTAGFNKWGMTSAMAGAMLLRDMLLDVDNPCAPVFSPSRSIFRPQLAVNAAETALSLITPTSPRCPHMGCALKYNAQEHSWDCPCHGSRFSRTGGLIDNPATDDI